MRPQQGFTLIELMITLFIICVLVGVAIPAYTDYLLRARVAEGFMMSQGARDAVSEYYNAHGRMPANNQVLGLAPPEAWRSENVYALSVENGEIMLRFNPKYEALADALVQWKPVINPANPIQISHWQCVGKGERAYFPSRCRSNP